MCKIKFSFIGVFAIFTLIILSSTLSADGVIRPEEIKSKRLVVYDDATYVKLESLWKNYYKAYPSEYAYANWMYAARYAGDTKYSEMLDKGLREYPSNPTLLYLKAIERHGITNDIEGQKYLEKAISIDPNFIDPWFLLVTHYMDSGDSEKLDMALRKILESGVITDEIMDYNYNMLISLDKNAIIITNGDNDTYPGWILTRILKIRPDVAIVNRSLLNTEWYPMFVISEGLPRFIGKSDLTDLRESIFKLLKNKKVNMSPGGPFGDTLITLIVDSAERAGRPVYISKTVFYTDLLRNYVKNGRDLGLATLITPSKKTYAEQLRKTYNMWVNDFRTGGLESWRLKGSQRFDAGRWLIPNYAQGVVSQLVELKRSDPGIRLKLFNWYNKYIENLLPEDKRTSIAQEWCRLAPDIKEIGDWSKKQGIDCD